MAPRGLAFAAVLVALAATATAAYRPEPPSWMADNEFPYASMWSQATGKADKSASTTLARSKGEGAYHAVRYLVDPERQHEFVDAWREFEKDTLDNEKGVRVFDLKKTVDDDVVFISYGEWKSFDDWVDHFKSDHAEKFIDRLRDLDIPFNLQPLYQPKDAGELHVKPEGGKHKRHLAHALVRYWAPPSAHDDLVDAWHEAMEETSKEKGVRIYSLRKAVNDNTQWASYGTWDSIEDLHDHFESEHVDKLKDRLAKLRVYWRITLLHKVGDQPE